jgi:hypothetical protein
MRNVSTTLLTADQIRAAARRYWIIAAAVITPAFGLLISNWAPLSQWIGRHLGLDAADVPRSLRHVIPVALFGILMLPITFYIQKRTLAKCPQCHTPIYPKQMDIVIATGNCSNCGAPIVNR